MWLISPMGISTPIVFRYLETSSHISGLALNKSDSGRVHLIGANNSIDKLEMFKVLEKVFSMSATSLLQSWSHTLLNMMVRF